MQRRKHKSSKKEDTMSSYITNTDYNSSTGFFEITSTNADGTTSTQNVNFSTMCMMFSLNSLNAQDEVFTTQFQEAQEQVNTMTMINDCMQMLNTYADIAANADGDSIRLDGMVACDLLANSLLIPMTGDLETLTITDENGLTFCVYYEKGSDAEKWLTVYMPALVSSGLIQDGGIGIDCSFNEDQLSATMENLQSAQSTVSSQNEQQMLITNDAASKRTSILQMAQSLMQAAADSRKSAAQS